MEENKELLKYVAYAIGGAMMFRFIFSAMFGLYVLAFPIVYLYLVQNCPKIESFNAKKELKRVLRGAHLAEDDPNKPKVSTDRVCVLSLDDLFLVILRTRFGLGITGKGRQIIS